MIIYIMDAIKPKKAAFIQVLKLDYFLQLYFPFVPSRYVNKDFLLGLYYLFTNLSQLIY